MMFVQNTLILLPNMRKNALFTPIFYKKTMECFSN